MLISHSAQFEDSNKKYLDIIVSDLAKGEGEGEDTKSAVAEKIAIQASPLNMRGMPMGDHVMTYF